jgi:hypothetical protein
MLPFLEPKRIATMLLKKKNPDRDVNVSMEHGGSVSDDDMQFHACAEDILGAVERKSVMDLARALKAFCEICQSGEDNEEESQEDHEY